VEREDINPWDWSTSESVGFSQAVDLRGAEQVLLCAGQTAIGSDGSPPSDTAMGAQLRKAFDNLSAVLEAAGLDLAAGIDHLEIAIGQERQPIARLERSQSLPKYDITIKPKGSERQGN